ncbi:MAG: heparinase II/III family protein [Clostridiaceae bacterium]|nr:heparinase II/III family protein [Clostridiaceae bacterium]
MKRKSILYTKAYLEAARTNADPAAAKLRREAVEHAAYWDALSDDELWGLMFGYTIRRSYTVWSDGVCPDCGRPVPMTSWIIDAKKVRWKVACPHCGALFPKNDFEAYYNSGLDDAGVFRTELADDRLLAAFMDEDEFRAARLYPDGFSDASYVCGVDDGDGANGGWCTQKRWYFIACYALRGQWRQLVAEGILALAQAYLVTGEQRYAHKAAVMLDRVADLLPPFDYHRQGLVYERPGDMGYVSTWHDSNFELRMLVLAYDMIFEGIRDDASLVAFLHEKSQRYRVPNPKNSFEDIAYNIDTRILRDILNNPRKVTLNYPGTETLLMLIRLVLDDPDEASRALADARELFRRASAVDGVTGERGIGGYAGFTADQMLQALEILFLYSPEEAARTIRELPTLEKTFRFYTDIYLENRFYPKVGDTSSIGAEMPFFAGVNLTHRIDGHAATPGFNLYSLLWKLWKHTGNAYYLDTLRRKARDGGAVCDIGQEDAPAFYAAIARPCAPAVPKSTLLPDWQLATLVSPSCAVWTHFLPYRERHGHEDTFHMGLCAFGLELLPDFGYPPVQYGGWQTPNATWYRSPWVHNGVIVDRERVPRAAWDTPDAHPAACTLWRDEDGVHAVSTAADGLYGTTLYDRTLVLVELSGGGCVLLDAARVRCANPAEHIRVMPFSFGTLTTDIEGADTLSFDDSLLFGETRGSKTVPDGTRTADFLAENRHAFPGVPDGVHLRVFELTPGRELYETSLWANDGGVNTRCPLYVPGLIARREARESVFAAAYVPYTGECPVARVTFADGIFTVTPVSGRPLTVSLRYDEARGGAQELTVCRKG